VPLACLRDIAKITLVERRCFGCELAELGVSNAFQQRTGID
jgi:hypothetical protein